MAQQSRTAGDPRFNEAVAALVQLRDLLRDHRSRQRQLAGWLESPLSVVRIEHASDVEALFEIYCEANAARVPAGKYRQWFDVMREALCELDQPPPDHDKPLADLDLTLLPEWIEGLAQRTFDYSAGTHLILRLIEDCDADAIAAAIGVLRECDLRFQKEHPRSGRLPTLLTRHHRIARVILAQPRMTEREIAKKLGEPKKVGSLRANAIKMLKTYGLTNGQGGYYFPDDALIHEYVSECDSL